MLAAILRVLILAMALAAPAHAQTVAVPTLSGAPTAATLTPAEADRALSVLQDPDQRAQLIATLQAVAKASAAPVAPAATPTASPLALQPDSLGAEIAVQAASWAKDFSDELVATARAATDVPLLWHGLVRLSSNAEMRAAALDTGWRLALVLGCALVVEALCSFLLRRPLNALEFGGQRSGDAAQKPDDTALALTVPAPEPDEAAVLAQSPPEAVKSLRLLRRLPLAILRLALSLVPLAAFATAGALLAATEVNASASTRLVLFEVLKAYVLCRAITCVARMLVSPDNRRLRLLQMTDQTAAYVEVWVRRMAIVTVIGATLAEVSQLLGWSSHLHHALVKVVALIVNLFLVVIVLQCRASVAKYIRPTDGARGSIAMLRNWLTYTWHTIAIFVIVALWLVWATRLQGDLSHSLQPIFMSIAVLVAARLFAILALGLLDRMFHVNLDLAKRFPGLEERANRYYPLLRRIVALVIGWIAVIALLEAWGVDALVWFRSDAIGGRLVSALTTIALALAIAVAVWEVANAAMERHLARLAREARYARSARLRTLQPILRSSLQILIVTVVTLTVLSEIGVNIAPLLAGAGIIGIAIGFGSQKLVQDLITGLFLLLENAMQVGDWVTVSGLSGSVENLSIRTIRLRAGDGSIHIVPFSSVTSVTNSNRGIGNAAISVSVAFEEDTDHVGQVLRQIADDMRRETKFKPMMLGSLQLWGVDKVDGASVTIVGQIVCTDSGRWDVQREFNRRMKQRFHELGIVIAASNQSVLVQRPVAAAAPEHNSVEAPHGLHPSELGGDQLPTDRRRTIQPQAIAEDRRES
ncbi:MAG: mechanosensitive ion channel [Ancalomicrobiaceae bacterium]|nr:mechanosensitive ion channel [Ancalomicrobiaceae bacterium]